MRLNFASLLLAFVCALSWAIAARADELRLHLKDGRVIAVEEVWEVGDDIWYRQGKIISHCAKTEIARIAKPRPAATTGPSAPTNSTNSSVSKAGTASPGKDTSGDEATTRKVSRIILKGGMQIDADAVWEDSGRVVYRLGKMQTFVDRSEVERVIRETVVNEQKAVASSSQLRFTTGHRGLDQLIVHSSNKYGLDPLLIYLVMREESGFNYRAVSRVGARGLMQLMPGTAARLGVRNIHDPAENVYAGTRYLRSLVEMFNGDVNLALAAYNAGENAVIKYGRRIPPYRETMNYVWRINTAYRRATAAK